MSSRMLKKAASYVLASLRDSTYSQEVRLASALAATFRGGGAVLPRRGGAGEKATFLNILRCLG